MARVHRFTVQSYEWAEGGLLRAEEPARFDEASQAADYADTIKNTKAGVVAYAWLGDMGTGERGKITVLRFFGSVPNCVAEALDL